MAARFTTGSKIVTGLTAGQIYRFTATSTQTAGLESWRFARNFGTKHVYLRGFFTRTKSSGIPYRSRIGSGEVMLELSHFLVFFTAKTEM